MEALLYAAAVMLTFSMTFIVIGFFTIRTKKPPETKAVLPPKTKH